MAPVPLREGSRRRLGTAYSHQPDRLHRIVLELDEVEFSVACDFRGDRHRAFAFAFPIQTQLNQREWVLSACGLVGGFPEADGAVGHQDDATSALFTRCVLREAQLVPDATR